MQAVTMSISPLRRLTLACAGLLSALGHAIAQPQLAPDDAGFAISVEVEGFGDTVAYLANYFLDKQYIVDTAEVVDGRFTFEGDTLLPEGTYLVVLPPDNEFAQIHLDADQRFALRSTADDLVGGMQVSGSAENELFYDYLEFLSSVRPSADSLRAIRADSLAAEEEQAAALDALTALDERVKARQQSIISGHPNTLTAALLRSQAELEFPDFEGTDAEVREQKYRFYKRHYFDGIDLGDPRALRSPYLAQRIDDYLEKLVVPHPDSISAELDALLSAMRPAPETFKFYTSKFLNDYAASNIVGMDAVYVHLGETYYMSGDAYWADSTTVAKIAENVAKAKPLLIGQPAPNLKISDRSGGTIDLAAVESPYTVLFFFDPECSHCKKQTPVLLDFMRTYGERGVKAVSVCSKFAPDADDCWAYVDSKEGMEELVLNGVDPYHRSKYKVKYDIFSYPQIFVLDAEKKILSKRISAEQLPDVLDRLMEMDAREADAAQEGR